ncbi:DUF3311 domain-containing protein [Amycolatopsis alkalitolerans]|uniref:DUF3311 domain-containing protein n=1 Tax=Amycolatopsis alkalitolerans TaxID=2547244 RepID=A0A5C4M1H0_9PSEU|nr:DUF3311 domain-containing protein [Amycolatopsis alkalitolerans]TNC25777.1 DUF3311 domain-containing protein [Amycolatopsis alkalitolerans]
MNRAEPPDRSRRRWHWLLLTVPFLWCIAALPLVGRIEFAFGSIPFLLVWMTVGVLIGTVCIGAVYVIDRRNGDLDRL